MTPWIADQQAVIDRECFVTIDRVTPSGRAVVGSQTFGVDGYLRGATTRKRPRLELLTPEVKAEMRLVVRGKEARKHDLASMRRERVRRLIDVHGGRFHGPRVEHFLMEEQAFWRFIDALADSFAADPAP